MEENCFQERLLILDVFENVKQQDDVISFAESRIAIKNIVTVAGLVGCDRILESVLIQIEPVHVGLVVLLELLLHQSTSTADFPYLLATEFEASSQLSQNIET